MPNPLQGGTLAARVNGVLAFSTDGCLSGTDGRVKAASALRSELEKSLAKDARLTTTHLQLLTAAQHGGRVIMRTTCRDSRHGAVGRIGRRRGMRRAFARRSPPPATLDGAYNGSPTFGTSIDRGPWSASQQGWCGENLSRFAQASPAYQMARRHANGVLDLRWASDRDVDRPNSVADQASSSRGSPGMDVM